MITWLTINLPWRNPGSPERLEVHRLSSEYTAWFDAHTAELFGPIPVIDWDAEHICRVMDSCPELDTTDWSSADAYEAFMASHPDPDVQAAATRRRHRALRDQFEADSSECQGWLDRIGSADRLARSRQFCDHELCRSGVALEIRSPTGELRRVIIGDVGPDGCDLATPQIADDDVIVRCADLKPIVEE